MSEIRDGENLWQWSELEIRLNVVRWSTILQKHSSSLSSSRHRRQSSGFYSLNHKSKSASIHYPFSELWLLTIWDWTVFQRFKTFVGFISFHATSLYYNPWKHHKTKDLLKFSGGYRNRPVVVASNVLTNIGNWTL